MRIAIYWTPGKPSPLDKAASDWLKEEDNKIPGIPKEEVQRLLLAPNHYGFHATIKPPFRLKSEYALEDVAQELTLFIAEKQNRPFTLPRFDVARIGQFICLKPQDESSRLQKFAAETLRRFDHFRKPADEDEITRRRASGLTARQDQLLLKWGYPYVLDEFIFHLTLTGNIQNPNHFKLLNHELLKRFSSKVKFPPCIFDSLSLFIQHDGKPFTEYRRWNFGRS